MKITRIWLLFALMVTSCSTSSVKNCEVLQEIYTSYFTIGAAYNEFNFETSLAGHFNSITAENAMKWVSVHPSKDNYTYEEADQYIAYAKAHNMGVRGHALVWHNEKAIPAEVFASNDKETILELEKEHIENVVTHFGDSVYCWDVVNEVIDDGTSPLKEDQSNIYRQSNWYKICGRDFIKEAYVKADEVLKRLGIRDKVKLFYNDYDNTKPAKKEKTLAMLRWLLEEGVPIDGIGLQSHYHLGSFDPIQLEESILDYAALGLDVQITEFDVDIYDETLSEIENYPIYDAVPSSALAVQATIYDRAFEIFRRHHGKISNVTFWGVYDGVTYMNENPDYGYRTNYPYIFDVNEGKKPAYYQITSFKEGK